MKKLIFLCLLIIFTISVSAQGPSFKDRIYVGGNFGASFSGSLFYVELSPLVGYRFTEKFSAGPTIKYQYFGFQGESLHNYGGGIFSRYQIFPSLFAHAEYEYLSLDYRIFENRRIDIHSYFVGGGYRQMLGEHAAFDLLLLYNLNETAYSPYQNPVIRMGISVGL